MIGGKKTKTDETKKDYAKRARTFTKLFRLTRKRDIRNDGECAVEFTDFLVERIKEKNYTSPTIRKIKASLVYYFDENGDDKLSKAVSDINFTPDKKAKPKPRTSAQKYKHIPDSEYYKLCLVINSSNGQYDQLAMTWMECTQIVGIRPKEWIQTRFITKENKGKKYYILKVLNAKNTNERSFGKFRHIILADLTDEEMYLIKSMMRFVESIRAEFETLDEAREKWDKIYQSVRNRLSYLDKKARPKQKKSITLYSARHQFAADLKVNVDDPRERTALMGHASVGTIDISYGKKHHGKKGRFRVRPHKDDVIKVHKLNPESKIMRLQNKKNYLQEMIAKQKPEQKNER